MLVLVLLLTSLLALAQTDEQTCGFWCKVDTFFWGDPARKALVGGAGETFTLGDTQKGYVQQVLGLSSQDLNPVIEQLQKGERVGRGHQSFRVNEQGELIRIDFEPESQTYTINKVLASGQLDRSNTVEGQSFRNPAVIPLLGEKPVIPVENIIQAGASGEAEDATESEIIPSGESAPVPAPSSRSEEKRMLTLPADTEGIFYRDGSLIGTYDTLTGTLIDYDEQGKARYQIDEVTPDDWEDYKNIFIGYTDYIIVELPTPIKESNVPATSPVSGSGSGSPVAPTTSQSASDSAPSEPIKLDILISGTSYTFDYTFLTTLTETAGKPYAYAYDVETSEGTKRLYFDSEGKNIAYSTDYGQNIRKEKDEIFGSLVENEIKKSLPSPAIQALGGEPRSVIATTATTPPGSSQSATSTPPTNVKDLTGNVDVHTNTATGQLIAHTSDGYYLIDPSTGNLRKLDNSVTLDKAIIGNSKGLAGVINNGVYAATGEDKAFGDGSKSATSVKALREIAGSSSVPSPTPQDSLNRINNRLSEIQTRLQSIQQNRENVPVKEAELAELQGYLDTQSKNNANPTGSQEIYEWKDEALRTKYNEKPLNELVDASKRLDSEINFYKDNVEEKDLKIEQSNLFGQQQEETLYLQNAQNLGVDSSSKDSIKAYQQKWIDKYCPNGVCSGTIECIGTKDNSGFCVADGILGPKTKADILTFGVNPVKSRPAPGIPGTITGVDDLESIPSGTGLEVDGKLYVRKEGKWVDSEGRYVELSRIEGLEESIKQQKFTVFNQQKIKKDLACFTTQNCPNGAKPITHREAWQRLDALAVGAQQGLLQNLPEGTTVSYDGKEYKLDNKDNKWKSGDEVIEDSTILEKALADGDATPGRVKDQNYDDFNEKLKEAQSLRKDTNTREWQGSWFEVIGTDAYQTLVKGNTQFGQIAGGVGALAQRLGNYRALSNLLVPDTTKSWMEVANSETLTMWADLPNFAAREACGIDEEKSRETPGKSAVFIHTIGNTYQFVGSIQAEKSPQTQPILCHKNSDQTSSQEWICDKKQVCVDTQFCYKDTNEDGKPEGDPLQGTFYKISWGVTAPTDEKFTPYIDENGVAVKFNIELRGDNNKWLYQRAGTATNSVLQLKNGARDGKTIVQYSPNTYTRACIKFADDGQVKDSEGDSVTEICANFIESNAGSIEYSSSSRTESTTSDSPEITENSDW